MTILSQKDELREFWNNFGGNKNDGRRYNEEKKLNLLKDYAFKSLGRRRACIREKFDRVKQTRHSLRSHQCCFVCGNMAEVRHHIIQLQSGGQNSKRNIVSLCKRCHKAIHPWLD